MNLRRKRKSFSIHLNSMSDVAFLLLIFIMIVALVNYRKEVKIEYPEAKIALRTSAENNLEVWIDKEGRIFLDGDAADLLALERKIMEIYITAPDTRVHIIADRYTPYEKINSALEVLQLLQYRVVSFVVKNNE
ncbi:MAG: biopolymer transporter ExbD [Treponema sp.]|nr:biopolymer transporter ExbD [Treponema sp.]